MRYLLVEAGHIGQNLYLAATALGLASVTVGAFLDRELEELLGLRRGREVALQLHAAGVPG